MITRSSPRWNSGVASWDEPDAVALGIPSDREQSTRPSLRLNLDKATKWGRCPMHLLALSQTAPAAIRWPQRTTDFVLQQMVAEGDH